MAEKKSNNISSKDLKNKMAPENKYEKLPGNVEGAPDMAKMAEDMEKLKTKLDAFKKKVIEKYKFTIALGMLPKGANIIFEEEEAVPKEVIESKPIHIIMLMPEEHYKDLAKIKEEVVNIVKETKENLWVHIKTPVDLWNYGLDSRFEFLDAISAAYPLFDNGFLGALRVANIHKSLVLRTFDKYVTTYVIAGSLVRGTADKDSDVDVFVIIDDTDVKRLSRIELLEKLRAKIYDYVREATALAGVKNILNVQVYLLTDFWQSVKDAQPVMFTFIRDGIPLYDRGTFIPWKRLLLMGKIKPSPEAIEQYMKQGEQTVDIVKRRLLDIMVDIYFGVVTPTQALMMLVGEAPPVPKVLVEEVKKVLVEREKVMNSKDIKTLEKAVNMYKQYEYGKLKELSGKEIDELLKESTEYNKQLKNMIKKIEKKMSEKAAEEIYSEVFTLLKTLLGDKSQEALIEDFENKLVKKGKVSPKLSFVLKEIVNVKRKLKEGKLNTKEVDRVKRDVWELVNALTEYGQRTDLICSERGTMLIMYKGRKAELVLMGNENNFMIEGNVIKKITPAGLKDSTKEEFEKAFSEHKGRLSTKVSADVFAVLKKELGDFEIVF